MTLEAVTFRPGDPPRSGAFVWYDPSARGAAKPSAARSSAAKPSEARRRAVKPRAATGIDYPDRIEVALPTRTGTAAWRRLVPARFVTVAEAIAGLGELDAAGGPGAQLGGPAGGGAPVALGAAPWARVLRAGLVLIARGRLYPAVSAGGIDTWRAGPLDPADRRVLAELAAAFPPHAHALVLDGPGPLRLHSPEHLIRSAWDALADALVRTAAAPLVSGTSWRGAGAAVPFASVQPVAAEQLRPWLADAAAGLEGAEGADVALRVELDRHGELDRDDELDDDELDDGDGELVHIGAVGAGSSAGRSGGEHRAPARAVVQLTSRAEASLVVDAADLYASPAAVLARFGARAESDLLSALRRVARAWPPAAALLRQRAPTALDLDEDLLAELLAEGASLLEGTGVQLLWPAEILADGLVLRAAVTTAPGVVVGAGLDLATLVEFRWQATLDGEQLSEIEIDQLAEAKRGLVRLRGRFVAVDPAMLERLRSRRARRLTAAEALGALLAGSIDLDGEWVPLVAEGPLAERLRSLSGADEQELAPPAGLAPGVELRPYQSRGITWLHAMAGAGIGGCLADDMGLGKTLQLIALHLHRSAASCGPALVVCPTSLLANWEREVHRFAPATPLRRYHGGLRSLDDLDPGELVITSYGVARRDSAVLAEAGFSLVVADEAQHAKNPETATARALRAIAAPVRFALTGTPVENRLSELWSILDWTTPGLLGPLERFTRNVAGPIERDRDPLTTERLARTIRPFVLRRKKTDPGVAPDLPARTVSDVPVPLTSEQVTLYEAEVREALAVIESEDGIARQGLVLKLLTRLKQICNHPAQYLHQAGPLAGRSGKLAALEELVEVIAAEGESVLVFSQFVECLGLIEARLDHLGVPTLFLHGKVAAARRATIVDAFQAGEAPVLLLSLKAGGVGLNLTRATHVVHFDRWWNPAVEEQATDRAHRIGQDRPVQVHRLIAEGTLEDHIAELIESKRALAEAVVGGGESWIGKLSNAELADLVRLGSGA